MEDPPRDYNICPCCGTEFDVDDIDNSISELRKKWIETGMRWWYESVDPPKGYNPKKQLADLLKNN